MSKGGITEAKPMPYCPPKGPKGINHEGPGLGGTNYGQCGTQGKPSPTEKMPGKSPGWPFKKG